MVFEEGFKSSNLGTLKILHDRKGNAGERGVYFENGFSFGLDASYIIGSMQLFKVLSRTRSLSSIFMPSLSTRTRARMSHTGLILSVIIFPSEARESARPF